MISLRQAGFKGAITLIGEDPAPPYQRPPLSKAYLKGELAKERLYLRAADFYEQQEIDLRLGIPAVQINREERRVVLADGEALGYDKLLLATGAPPRRLAIPGADLENLYYLRTLADADTLRNILSVDGRIVIVGAGYIGLEVAAVARASGRDVTVLEMADRVLARVASKSVSDFYESLHRDAGVDVRLGAALSGFDGSDGAIAAATLGDGGLVECVAALIGVGAVPAAELAEQAGLEVANGIVVDQYARTSDPAIWAAGDCVNFPSERYGRRLRLESVPNAIEQAKVAGANMAGGDHVYDPLPWFWSDQYAVKLQTVGLSEGFDDTVLRGEPDEKSFSVWYFKQGSLIAVDAINDPASFAVGKRLLTDNTGIDAASVENAQSVKSLLAK